jgi:hypothetical protein
MQALATSSYGVVASCGAEGKNEIADGKLTAIGRARQRQRSILLTMQRRGMRQR